VTSGNSWPVHLLSIVIPANAGIQLNTLRRAKLDPDFRQGDEEEIRRSSPRMTSYKTVMAGLDPAILTHAADARIEAIEWLSRQAGP
jgi:hypothetical protein